MNIKFIPRRRDDTLSISKSGDELTINDKKFDFGPLTEGSELPSNAVNTSWITGPVRRENGVLHVSLVLPHGPNAPQETRFPEPIHVVENGPVALPAYTVAIAQKPDVKVSNDGETWHEPLYVEGAIEAENGQTQEVHSEAPSVTSDGAIDWSQMTTPESRAKAALEEWRKSACVSKTNFCVALVKTKLLSPEQAVSASQGNWPEPMLDFLAHLNDEQAAIAEIEWASSSMIHRNQEFVDLLSWWLNFTPDEVDELFVK